MFFFVIPIDKSHFLGNIHPCNKFTLNLMWKKLLASVTAVMLFSTVSFAGILDYDVAAPQQDLLSNFTVSDTVLESGGNDSVNIQFTVSSAVFTYVIVKNSSNAVVLEDYVSNKAGTFTYTWSGEDDDNDQLANGAYKISVHAVDFNNFSEPTIVDQENNKTVTIGNGATNDEIEVTNFEADPSTFSVEDGEDTEISFEVSEDAYLTAVIKKNGTVIREFSDYEDDWYDKEDDHSINWDGTDDDDDEVSEGTYTFELTAENDDAEVTKTITITVADEATSTSGVIESFTLNPKSSWDPTEDELEIEYELNDEADVTIEAKNGNKVIEIMEEDDQDDDEYTEPWDGTDDDGDYIKEGTWEIILRADGDKVSKTINVEFEKPEIEEAFVTKASFDPSEDESTNLVFKADADAVVKVEVYQGSKREFVLVDDMDVNKDDWYSVEWDGTDDDNDEVDEGTDWKFKIIAENESDDDVMDSVTVEVDVEEDDVSSKKSNITQDYIDPVVYDENSDDKLEFGFCIDEDAEMYLAVYEGKSASGGEEAELLDYVDYKEGCHKLTWNGEDDDNDDLKEGLYSYKMISKDGSNKDTEVGRFVVGELGGSENDDDDDEDEDEDEDYDYDYDYDFDDEDYDYNYGGTGKCDAYYDLRNLSSSNELCEAIEWATANGIFEGYSDGSFKPYKNINRAESLKVVLETFDEVTVFPMDGSKLGFKDVDAYGWYMPYVRTAKFYGMFNGYDYGKYAKLNNNVTRAELLKFVLEASKSFTSYELSNGYFEGSGYDDVKSYAWFYDYAGAAYEYNLYDAYSVNGGEYLYPDQEVERGEVALVLFRMSKAGLL